MDKIIFEEGTLVTPAKVNEDGTITPAVWEGKTPLTPHTLNLIQDNIETAIEDSKKTIIVTDAYSSSSTYAVGDYCIYGNTLYKCTTAITTAENWNSAHWAATTIATEFEVLETAIEDSKKTIIVTEAGTDLNNYIENGIYYFSDTVTPENIPARLEWIFKSNNNWNYSQTNMV